jgi:hypothetical protein
MERLTQGYSGSYLGFLPSISDFVRYPEGNFSWHHLWYLAYISTYSLLLLPVLLYLRRTTWDMAKTKGWVLLLFTGIWFSTGAILLSERFPGTNALVHEWPNHYIYLRMFLFGFMLIKAPALQHKVRSIRWYSLGAVTITISWLYAGY